MLEAHNQASIIGVVTISFLEDRPKPRIGRGGGQVSERSGTARQLPCQAAERIQGTVGIFLVRAVVADVHGAQSCMPSDSLLQLQTPLVVAWNLRCSRIEEAECGNRSTARKVRVELCVRGLCCAVSVARLSR